MSIGRREIFRTADAKARAFASFDDVPSSYLFHFQRALQVAWADVKRAEQGRKALEASRTREAARHAQNFGAPIRSFRDEKTFFGGTRFTSVVGQ